MEWFNIVTGMINGVVMEFEKVVTEVNLKK